MTRQEFIRLSGIFGLGLPLQASLMACDNDEVTPGSFDGKVIIIGAGAGGLAAGYFLKKRGIDFEIIEASATHGGRMRTNTDFADFPIPLGAEWLHTNSDIFQQIVDDEAVNVEVETVGYDQQVDTLGFWDGQQLQVRPLIDSDRKFINATWFDFYDRYIVPSIKTQITFNTVVESIDYSSDEVIITTQNGQLKADKIILAVPLKILQLGHLTFTPALPDQKIEDINKAQIWDGFKAFFEFSEKFYHTATGFNITPETDGQKLYYDASYGQNTDQKILGLFVVGKPAQPYLARKDEDLRNYILGELDEIYAGAASQTYLKHLTQNWNEEPYARGAYLIDHENWRLVRRLADPVANKLFFAGGAFTDGEDWVAVENAAASARNAVNLISQN